MFLLFGISPKIKRHGFVMRHCSVHRHDAWHELVTQRSWFNLFFVLKLFPIGREHHVISCTECGVAYELDDAEMAQLSAQTVTEDAARYTTTPQSPTSPQRVW